MISKLTTGEYSSMTRARIWRSFRSQNRVSELIVPTFERCVKLELELVK